MQHQITGYLLDSANLNEQEQVRWYRAYLECLVDDAVARSVMGQAGLLEARRRSWSAAMQPLLNGYRQVIEAATPLAAA